MPELIDGYGEWLNEAIFGMQTVIDGEDTVLWLGDNEWLIGSNLDPGELFRISIKRVELRDA